MTEQQENWGSSAEMWLRKILDSNADDRLKAPLNEALKVLNSELQADASRPFLSVVMRTQGRKPEAFKDALVTLFGQTDRDFELLVTPHNVDDETLGAIKEIVDIQAPSFRRRIRVIPVEGGGRSRPLNKAIEESKGRYLAFFDDDDLVLGNWVEVFRQTAETHPRRLIRAVASTQRMQFEGWPGGAHGFRSTTWPKAEYLKTFEIERHLERNHTPFMSVAFPRELFTTWGERFDEELDVCEDWDMILRGAFLLGVVSVDELTVVYRLWTGVTSSYTEHDLASWRRSEERVQAKLNRRPLIFPEGSPASLIESMQQEVAVQSGNTQLVAVLGSTSWRITAPIRRVVRAGRAVARRVLKRS